MNRFLIHCLALLAPAGDPLGPGDHGRALKVGELNRSYLVHVPKSYNPRQPTPVVVAFHGASMDAPSMAAFTGLDKKSEQAGFIVAYPNGTGLGNLVLTWNAGGLSQTDADDVAFSARMLDDLASVVNVDRRRIYATGMSNGAMMAYRVAARLPERIAAIAPVAGTMTVDDRPKCPVPVLHLHGTKDTLVPFRGPDEKSAEFLKFCSVEDTVKTWARCDGCPLEPKQMEISSKDDLRVRCERYGPGKEGAEVILYVVEGGGHAWPGRPNPIFLGKTTYTISANDLMWDFFRKHARK